MKLLTAAMTLALFFSVVSRQTHAQTVPRFEVGGQVFSSGSRDLGYGYGAGGRFTYNFKNYLALDTEIGAFQSDEGRTYASQGFIGARVGKRSRYFGVFAKARPGYSTFFVLDDDPRAKPRFVVDVGGVFEAYPTKHLLLRLDVGDTILPLGNETVGGARRLQRPEAIHSLQVSLGLGVRF